MLTNVADTHIMNIALLVEFFAVCCSMLQHGVRTPVCCSVLQCGVVRCSGSQCVGVCCSVLLTDVADTHIVNKPLLLEFCAVRCSVLQHGVRAAVCCIVLQCVAVCRSALQ